MSIKNLKKISIGFIVLLCILEVNSIYSNADTSGLIEHPSENAFTYYHSESIVISIYHRTCEYYYIFASETEFTEYNESLFRLERIYNSQCMNPIPEVNYSDFLYDWQGVIFYWRLPSNWTECYFGVVCVNESSNLWSYPVISQKVSIPDGLERPDPIPDPPPDPIPIDPPVNEETQLIIILSIIAGVGCLAVIYVLIRPRN